MRFPDFRVVETEIGPMVGESRTSIYDVLLSLKEGSDFFALCVIHNLKPIQVHAALDYVEVHRAELEAKLPELLAKKPKMNAIIVPLPRREKNSLLNCR